jgi:outer membrane murein-binding lipoprotein Lpp
VDAAQDTRPRLGRVLVDAGLLTEDQLQAALSEQTQTGRRLGEIVVERGYLSGPALANALATQHGGVVRTEYGIATGFGPAAPSPPRPTAEPPASVPAFSPPARQAPPEPATPEPVLERESIASEPALEPESIASEPAPEPIVGAQQTVSLLNVLEDWSGRLEELRAKVAQLEAELGATRNEFQVTKSELEATKVDLESARAELRTTRDQLAEATSRLEELERKDERAPEPAQEPEAPAPVPYVREIQEHPATPAANGEHRPSPGPADTHLMSVPTATGFVLIERPGPTPAVGTHVQFEEEPDARFVVTKVNAASDLNPRPCAFLERL